MAPRANGKGFLRLSLATCPVALYPATSDSEKISFNQINRNTGHRIKYTRVDEVRSQEGYFDDIQDVKVSKDMLDLAKHIVQQKSGRFEPDKFEDRYEAAPVDLINTKRSGKLVTPRSAPR
jgi:non-homologous end joining protein Ku